MTDHRIGTVIASWLPDVVVGRLLLGQVLANLLDDANRQAPPNRVITHSSEVRDSRIAVSVTDQQIWVEDAPGAGARIIFALPLAPTNGTRR